MHSHCSSIQYFSERYSVTSRLAFHSRAMNAPIRHFLYCKIIFVHGTANIIQTLCKSACILNWLVLQSALRNICRAFFKKKGQVEIHTTTKWTSATEWLKVARQGLWNAVIYSNIHKQNIFGTKISLWEEED